MKEYDVTKTSGIKKAAKELKNPDLLLLLAPGGPFIYAGKKIIDAVFSTTEATIEQQRKTAIEIIKQGQKSGAKRIQVTLDQEAGLNFGSEIEDIPVKVMVGKSGKMTIEVEYK